LDAWDGSFVAVATDAQGGAWVATDRFAGEPVFVTTGTHGTAAASAPGRAAAAAGRTPELDRRALLQLLLLGFIPGDRSILEGVDRLPYGTWFDLTSGSSVRWWSFGGTEHAEDTDVELSAALDTVSTLEDEAVRRLTGRGEREAVLLSGGYDSRAILHRLLRDGDAARIEAYTYGGRGTPDVDLARQLATIAGIEHRVLPLTYELLVEGAHRWATLVGDPTENLLASLPGGPDMVDGIVEGAVWLGTDAFSTGLPTVAPPPGPLVEAVASRPIPPTVLTAIGAVPDQAQQLVDAWTEIECLAEPRPGEPWHRSFDRIAHEIRFRLWNVNRAALANRARVNTPWYDVTLVEHYAGLPVELRAGKRVHRMCNEAAWGPLGAVPVRRGGLGHSHIDALVADRALQHEVAERTKACNAVSTAIDVERLVPPADLDPAAAYWPLTLLSRAFVAAVWFDAAVHQASTHAARG
jgi:hypothetical protein